MPAMEYSKAHVAYVYDRAFICFNTTFAECKEQKPATDLYSVGKGIWNPVWACAGNWGTRDCLLLSIPPQGWSKEATSFSVLEVTTMLLTLTAFFVV